MNIEELLARLEENANSVTKPVTVQVDGLGTLYVRKRTVQEFEEMAAIGREKGLAGSTEKPGGLFGPSLARLLCDEEGKRLPAEYADRLAALLAKQPETVFHAIIEAADGKTEKPTEAKDEGN